MGVNVVAPNYLSLLLCLGISAALVLFYLYGIVPFVLLPADILMWAESSFVGDIIKLRIGAPLYGPPADSNSTIYTPGATLATYAISWLVGAPTSIGVWRVIHLGYVACAALLATACCRMLYGLTYPGKPVPYPRTWISFTFLVLFLASTESRTNRFAHALHADALALLVSVFSFWTMLMYQRSPERRNLLLMAVCPAIGFFTKQYLISWSAVMLVFLLLRNPKDARTLAAFAAAAATGIISVVGVCYWLWGDNFLFWTFEVTGGSRKALGLWPESYNLSLSRGAEHLLRAWLALAIGVLGGWLVLREHNIQRLGPLWVSWLVLVASEALSSSAGWGALYHFGPGVVLGAVWLCCALARWWLTGECTPGDEYPRLTYWVRPLGGIVAVITLFVVLQVVPSADRREARYWRVRHPSADVHRYISDIEGEFRGLSADRVLLDVGSWVYLGSSVVAKDRAVPLGDQAPAGIYGNFDVMIERIKRKAYAKILVRNLHSPFFLYDWSDWPRPSGVRKALSEHYTEVRTIPGARGESHLPPRISHTGPVSVLVPKE